MKKLTALFLAMVMVFSFTACSQQTAPVSEEPAADTEVAEEPATEETSVSEEAAHSVFTPEVTDVSIGFASAYESILYGYIVVAEKLGYFAEEGLNFTCEQTYSNSATVMVAEGQATMSLPGPHLTCAAVDQGVDVISVFQAYPIDIFGVAVKADSEYHEWKDFVGADFGTMTPTTRNQLLPLLASGGVTEDQVTLTPVTDGRIQTLMADKADAVWTWDGEWQQWVAEGYDIRFISGEDVYKSSSNSFICSKKFVEENPETVKAMCRAIAKGMYFCYCNPKAAAQIILDNWTSLTFDLDTCTELVKSVLIYAMGGKDILESEEIGKHFEERWSLLMSDYVKFDIVSKELPLDQCFTNEFVTYANDFDKDAVKAEAEAYGA